ncbi:MAG: putative 4-hydroxybenzoate polyprenyltransferase [Bacteroidia bacterium]|nr:putative 4-hydroxybenzoate polyprenyltransferase [Bacteroidia bacterium]
MARIKDYFSLVVFSHTIFAMPFALIGFFLAIRYSGYPFSWLSLLLCLGCMVFARNSAMGFNRWADRFIDGKNPRTAQREIPKGIIKGNAALTFSLGNAALFIVVAGLINPLCLILSPLALTIILGYSFTKRFTWLCHLILGLGLSIAPIGAYISIAGQFHWLPLMFSAVVLTWVGGFDIIYALQDTQFDESNGFYSIPSKIGIRNALIISMILHLLTVALVVVTGLTARFGPLYWLGCLIFIALLVYQHLIVKSDDLTRVNRAFGTTNGIASVIFAVLVIADLFVR